ncbi:MAG: hypothetical protein AB7F86_20660 [Bdellovibrionales bacterium]
MKKTTCLLLASTLGLSIPSYALSDFEQTKANMIQLGYSCQGQAEGRAFHCQIRVPHYSMPIDIFISNSLRAADPTLVYYLHGFWLSVNPFDGPNGDFARFLVDAGRNAVLIIPESRGRNETYANELNTAAKINRFTTEIESALIRAGLAVTPTTPTLLAGHSGAYVAMGIIGSLAQELVRFRQLRGVSLLDSAYGYRTGLVSLNDILCQNGGGYYQQAFNPSDGSAGKRDTNRRIKRELNQSVHACPGRQHEYLEDTRTGHYAFPRAHLTRFISQAIFW